MQSERFARCSVDHESDGRVPGVGEVIDHVESGIIALWDLARAVPTRKVVAVMAPHDEDKRLVFLQEWLAEDFTISDDRASHN